MKRLNIREELIKQSEESYKTFSCSLMPNVSPNSVLGVRVPKIRSLAKKLSVDDFKSYSCEFHEEKILKAFVISNIRDFEECIAYTE